MYGSIYFCSIMFVSSFSISLSSRLGAFRFFAREVLRTNRVRPDIRSRMHLGSYPLGVAFHRQSGAYAPVGSGKEELVRMFLWCNALS